jgi:hypothetical protein
VRRLKATPVTDQLIPDIFTGRAPSTRVLQSQIDNSTPFRKGFDINGAVCVVSPPRQRTYEIACPWGNFFKSFFEAGLLEESLKLASISVFASHNVIADPVAMMIYGLAAANGFAAFEAVSYLLNALTTGGVQGVAAVALVRALTAVPLHSITGVIIGGFLARKKFLKERYPVHRILLVPVLVHGLYDFIAFEVIPRGSIAGFALLLAVVAAAAAYSRHILLGFRQIPLVDVGLLERRDDIGTACDGLIWRFCRCCLPEGHAIGDRMRRRAASVFRTAQERGALRLNAAERRARRDGLELAANDATWPDAPRSSTQTEAASAVAVSSVSSMEQRA